jgi:hypothetical protein
MIDFEAVTKVVPSGDGRQSERTPTEWRCLIEGVKAYLLTRSVPDPCAR